MHEDSPNTAAADVERNGSRVREVAAAPPVLIDQAEAAGINTTDVFMAGLRRELLAISTPEPAPERTRPFWQMEACPAWCTVVHDVDDTGPDRAHYGQATYWTSPFGDELRGDAALYSLDSQGSPYVKIHMVKATGHARTDIAVQMASGDQVIQLHIGTGQVRQVIERLTAMLDAIAITAQAEAVEVPPVPGAFSRLRENPSPDLRSVCTVPFADVKVGDSIRAVRLLDGTVLEGTVTDCSADQVWIGSRETSAPITEDGYVLTVAAPSSDGGR